MRQVHQGRNGEDDWSLNQHLEPRGNGLSHINGSIYSYIGIAN